jgi:hypothetical protein
MIDSRMTGTCVDEQAPSSATMISMQTGTAMIAQLHWQPFPKARKRRSLNPADDGKGPPARLAQPTTNEPTLLFLCIAYRSAFSLNWTTGRVPPRDVLLHFSFEVPEGWSAIQTFRGYFGIAGYYSLQSSRFLVAIFIFDGNNRRACGIVSLSFVQSLRDCGAV